MKLSSLSVIITLGLLSIFRYVHCDDEAAPETAAADPTKEDPPPETKKEDIPAAAEEAKPDAGGGGGGSEAKKPSVVAAPKDKNASLIFDENQSAEEPAEVYEAVVKMEKLHCDTMFVDCIDQMTNLHRHTKKEKLEAKCLKQTKGFLVCGGYSKTDADAAPTNVAEANATPAPPLTTPAPE